MSSISEEKRGQKCERAYLNTEIEFSYRMTERAEGLWCLEMNTDRGEKQRTFSFKDE